MLSRIGEQPLGAVLPSVRQRIDSHFEQYPNGHVVHGRAAVASDVKLSGNDYLAIGNDPRILRRQLDALAERSDVIFMSGVYTRWIQARSATFDLNDSLTSIPSSFKIA